MQGNSIGIADRPRRPRIYLDHNATMPIRPEAERAAVAALRIGGNASSIHAEGRAARNILEDAREEVAALVGAAARDVVFTSGATEALNLALSPGVRAGADGMLATRLFVSAIEHPAVREGHRFPADRAETIPVLADGTVDLPALAGMLGRFPAERVLVALMAANNETGVVQPVREAADLVHAAGGLLLVDAVQAAGRIAVSVEQLGADMLVLSGHKIGGPAGAGALVLGRADLVLPGLVRGGGQERGRRAGTENLAGIAGFGAAAAAALRGLSDCPAMAALRDGLEARMRGARPDHAIFGEAAPRLGNTSCFATPGLPAETALIAFDLAGVAVSSGSACSSGKVKASHVLDSMGVPPDLMHCAVRVSLGPATRADEIDHAFDVWKRYAARRVQRAA